VSGPLARQHDLLEKAAGLDERIAVIGREGERIAAEGRTAAGHPLAAVDRIIDAARPAHQGTGPLSPPASDPNDGDGGIGYRRDDGRPHADERAVRLALKHIRTPLAGEQPGDE